MADVAVPVFKKRSNKAANIRKRPSTPPPEESASDSDSTDDEGGVRIKRRKKNGLTTSSAAAQPEHDVSKYTAYAADRSATIAINEDATKASNWYTDAALVATDAPSTQPQARVSTTAAAGTYQGAAKYSNFIEKSANAPNRHIGPVRAPTNVRAITVTDFAPDVCKDYKQTGFCGFGDSCKFLHAREDYKQGWQLDKEWESASKRDKKPAAGGAKKDQEDPTSMDPEEKMLQEIPFACIICKEAYENPVKTKCGHYFCQTCAMARYMKEKKKHCAACGADTQGSFASAKKLKLLLEKKQKRAEERQAQEGDEAED